MLLGYVLEESAAAGNYYGSRLTASRNFASGATLCRNQQGLYCDFEIVAISSLATSLLQSAVSFWRLAIIIIEIGNLDTASRVVFPNHWRKLLSQGMLLRSGLLLPATFPFMIHDLFIPFHDRLQGVTYYDMPEYSNCLVFSSICFIIT